METSAGRDPGKISLSTSRRNIVISICVPIMIGYLLPKDKFNSYLLETTIQELFKQFLTAKSTAEVPRWLDFLAHFLAFVIQF